MKIGLLVFFVGLSAATCSSTPSNAELQAETVTDCAERNFVHKSIGDLQRMSADQLFQEAVNEQIYHHMPATNDDYRFEISKLTLRVGERMYGPIIKAIDAYDPAHRSDCNWTRFHIAFWTADSLDNRVVRLRASQSGKRIIEALQKAIDRMKAAGFGEGGSSRKSDLNLAVQIINGLSGVNQIDEEIKQTLISKKGVAISDDRVEDFTNFLLSLDPKYPSWSEPSNDPSAGTLKDSERYYRAYEKYLGRAKATRSLSR